MNDANLRLAREVLNQSIATDSDAFLKFCRVLNIVKRIKAERNPARRGALIYKLNQLYEQDYITRAQGYDLCRRVGTVL